MDNISKITGVELDPTFKRTDEYAGRFEMAFLKAAIRFRQRNGLSLGFSAAPVECILDTETGERSITLALKAEFLKMNEAPIWAKFLARYANSKLSPDEKLTFNDAFFEADADNKVCLSMTAVRGAK